MRLRKSLLKKSIILAVLSTASLGSAAAMAESLQQRVERLERMANNPVILEMTQKVSEQEREIQNLQDQLDRIRRDLSVMPEAEEVKTANSLKSPGQLEKLQQAITTLQTELVHSQNVQKVQAARIIVLEDDLRRLKGGATGPSPILEKTPSEAAAAISEEETVSPNIVANDQAASVTVDNSSAAPISTQPATVEEQKAYQDAFALMRKSDYDGSIQAFQKFLDVSKQSDLAPNSYYWMGEGHFIKGEFEPALKAFKSVYQLYPQSAKAADAMVRGADALVKMEKVDEGKALYQKAIKEFPGSRAANNAEKRLEKL